MKLDLVESQLQKAHRMKDIAYLSPAISHHNRKTTDENIHRTQFSATL